MNTPDAPYCSGCGRELGLEPIAGPELLDCPDCVQPLTAFGAGPGALYDCARCGGQLVEHALLRELLERREVCGVAVPRRPLGAPRSGQPVRYLPCPVCKALMNRHNFGGTSGVIVDICAKHGVWFDAGELPRVLEFVEGGGLARARQRELERLDLARRQSGARSLDLSPDSNGLVAPVVLGTAGALAHTEPPAWSTGLWEDARKAVAEVLQLLGEQIAKR